MQAQEQSRSTRQETGTHRAGRPVRHTLGQASHVHLQSAWRQCSPIHFHARFHGYLYKGVYKMAMDYAKSFYKSRAWRDCRASYYAHQHGLCERCQGAGKIVHHKTYITPENINDLNITLSFNNLELLCQDCHNKEHHGGSGVTRSDVMFDENGDVVRV